MPSRRFRLVRVAVMSAAFLVGVVAADRMMTARTVADDAAPATTRATTRAASRPTIPADAQAVLDRVTAAYAQRPIEVAGTLEQHFDVAGIVRDVTLPLRGLARSGTTFRHEAGDALLVVGDGKSVHYYDPQRKRFRTVDLDAGATEPPAELRAVLASQSPALGVALFGDAARAIVPDDAADVRRLAPTSAEGGAFDRVAFEDEGVRVEVWVRADGTIDRATYDFAPMLARDGAAAVKRAQATVRYEPPRRAVGNADADALFAFAPPAEARDVGAGLADGAIEASALEGKPAPAFAIKTLDDKEVRLADLRGKVVVLDFWATWCGPCQASLPHLSTLAQKYAGRGVRTFAVNQQEEAETVREFLKATPVPGVETLLDADGKVGAAYGVEGIPQTVVIDASGTVRKVIVGFNPDAGPAELEAAVERALAR